MQGIAAAQFGLGACYDSKVSAAKNEKLVAEFFLKAAEQGNVRAQFNLGIFYEYGIGVTASRNTSRYWLERAAGQGYQPAKDKLKSFGF